jgi:hypothetical protein
VGVSRWRSASGAIEDRNPISEAGRDPRRTRGGYPAVRPRIAKARLFRAPSVSPAWRSPFGAAEDRNYELPWDDEAAHGVADALLGDRGS